MKKRFFVGLLLFAACVMLAGSLKVSAASFSENGLHYVTFGPTADKTVEVTPDGTKKFKNLVIPAQVTYSGTTYDVARVGYMAFYGDENLQSLVLPKTMKEIDYAAFSGCYNLKKVTLNQGLEILNESCFSCVPADFKLPSSLKRIDYAAFYGSGIKKAVIPNGFTKIENNVFGSCKQLKKVKLPKSVKTIGEFAFSACESLEKIKIPAGVKEIGNMAFDNTAIESIKIPKKITVIPEKLCFGCKNLKSVTFKGKITKIGEGAFSGCALESFEIPETVKEIAAGAFYGNPFTSIKIPEGVTKLNPATFADCTNLTEVVLPESLNELLFESGWSEGVFQDCTSLRSITLPKGITKLPDYVFYGCDNLETINCEGTVTEIGTDCFALTKWLKDNTEANDYFVFAGTLLGVNEYATEAEAMQSGREYIWSGKRAADNETKIVFYTQYDIPQGVKKIANQVFQFTEYDHITVNLPGSLEEIGDMAFYQAKIEKISIPSSVRVIGSNAFNSCEYLESIVIPDGITEIPYGMVENCRMLTNIKIPDSVTSIGDNAFDECWVLESVELPANIEGIHDITNRAIKFIVKKGSKTSKSLQQAKEWGYLYQAEIVEK